MPGKCPSKRKLNSQYAKAIFDCNNKLKKAANDSEKAKIYIEFSQNYLMPGKFWRERFHIDEDYYMSGDVNSYKEGRYQFFYWAILHGEKDLCSKLLYTIHSNCDNEHYNGIFGILKPCKFLGYCIGNLMYPHRDMRQLLMKYEFDSPSPLPQALIKSVEKLEKLFWKINEAHENYEEWLECLMEANDPEFLKQNVEHRLLRKLSDKKLWKIYINYLKKINPSEMLQLYSKYCRFFLDDDEMKEEYKKEAEKYAANGIVNVPWKNPFEFERSVLPSVEKETWIPYNKDKWLMHTKYSNNIFFEQSKNFCCLFNQRWPLPSSTIRYIVDHSKPLTYAKLQTTCKYFYSKKPKLYCFKIYSDKFLSPDRIDFDAHSLTFNPNCHSILMKPFKTKKIVITMSFLFCNSANNLSLSYFIKTYIYECDAKYIKIIRQIITQNELKFLCGRGNVEDFEFYEYSILKSDGTLVLLEDILFLLPNIRIFCVLFPYEYSYLPISNKLSKLKLNHKLLEFKMYHVSDLDEYDCCEFVKKNAAPFSEIHIILRCDERKGQKMEQTVQFMLNKWTPIWNKPYIQLSIN